MRIKRSLKSAGVVPHDLRDVCDLAARLADCMDAAQAAVNDR
jgi:hypothetical protein